MDRSATFVSIDRSGRFLAPHFQDFAAMLGKTGDAVDQVAEEIGHAVAD